MSHAARILMRLPGIFNATAALQTGEIKEDQFNQVMWRWKTAGLVKPIGERADVWLNLVVDKEETRARWERAVLLALPQVIVAGHGVLMRGGLTTQLASGDYLIRPARSASAKIDQAAVHERSAVWIKRLWKMEGAIDVAGILPQLDPGAALADLLLFDAGSIDVDDIEWDDMSSNSMELYESLFDQAGVDAPAASSRTRDAQRRSK